MIWLLYACADPSVAKPDTTPKAEPLVVAGTVTGALVGRKDVVVAAVDASAYRFGDATDASILLDWEPATGAFRIELDPTVPVTDLWAKFFVAAWEDLDGDSLFDAPKEALCDQPSGGAAVDYLTFTEANGWALGVDRRYEGEVGLHYTPSLDGDACSSR